MELLVRHQTVYRYTVPAARVAMRLKLMPIDTAAQRVVDWHVSVNGDPVEGFCTNGFGEMEATWLRHARLDEAVIVAQGVVETRDTHGVAGLLRSVVPPIYYLRDTPLTAPCARIRALAMDVGQAGADGALARLHALSCAVADRVAYRAGVTTAQTSAAQAFALGAGVCQDHAQIFIAAARLLGVPARYVSGYLLAARDDALENALHETHGWAEAFLPDLGWIGFDPSNRICATDRYLRVASGLDAADAAPIRGCVTVSGDISIDADVRIAQTAPGSTQRQLQRQQQQATPASDS